MPKDAALLLEDILAEVRFLAELHARHDIEDVLADRTIGHALKYAFLAIGEAAKRLPPSVREDPAIPWRKMIAARDFVAHGYDLIRLDVLWDTIPSELLPIIPHLEAAIAATKRR